MIEFSHGSAAEPPASDLLAAMGEEIAAMYDHALDAPDMPKAGPAELSPPGGALLVGREDGEVVCVGGLKRLPDGACEIKRMYVVPQARGRGAGRQLLRALEDEARRLGYEIARLDTGPKQRSSQRMYEEAGYRPIGNFNANPVASFWGEKRLDGSPPDMSVERRVELVTAWLEHYKARRLEAVVSLLAPDAVYWSIRSPIEGPHVGRDGFRRLWQDWMDDWDELGSRDETWEPDGDDGLIGHGVVVARGPTSRIDINERARWDIRFADGYIAEVRWTLLGPDGDMRS